MSYNIAGQVGIVEFVCVAQAFVRNERDVFPAKRMAFARREVPKRHFECAADFRFQMRHSAGKAVGGSHFASEAATSGTQGRRACWSLAGTEF
jgi:hypothetical protein